MTKQDKIEYIDDYLMRLEDVLHGELGDSCTNARGYFNDLKAHLTEAKEEALHLPDVGGSDKEWCKDCGGFGWITDEAGYATSCPCHY